MTDFLMYAGLSALALGLHRIWFRAPARWRFRLAVLMLMLALVPLSLIPVMSLPESAVPEWTRTVVSATPLSFASDSPVEYASAAVGFEFKSWWLSVGGGLFFLWLLVRQFLTLRNWRRCGRLAPELSRKLPENLQVNADIWVLPASRTAITTGFWRPTVWIGEQLLTDQGLDSVLTHELTHARHGDHRWAVVVTATRCLLCWHPLVWLWSAIARREMEFSCDQACQQRCSPDRYRRDLALLLRDQARFATPVLSTGFFARPNLNIQRLKRMEVIPVVRLTHKYALIAALIIAPLVFLRPLVASDGPAGGSYINESESGIVIAFDDVPLNVILRTLVNKAGFDSVYVHPDLNAETRTFKLKVEVADWREAIPRVLGEINVLWRSHGKDLIVAPEYALASSDWMRKTYRWSARPPRGQIRAQLAVTIDGRATIDIENLVLIEDNWTGFMAQETRINLRARSMGDGLVELALIAYEKNSNDVVAAPLLITKYDATATMEFGSEKQNDALGSMRIDVTPHRL